MYDEQDAIIALDAHTLELRFRFGGGTFGRTDFASAIGTAVVGDELFVGDQQGCCVQVFSLTGQHLREVRGDFRQPCCIDYFDGRLFLVEHAGDDEVNGEGDLDETAYEEWPQARREAKRCIHVLTPEGQTLQVWRAPGSKQVDQICLFRGELLVYLRASNTSLGVQDEDAFVSLAGI